MLSHRIQICCGKDWWRWPLAALAASLEVTTRKSPLDPSLVPFTILRENHSLDPSVDVKMGGRISISRSASGFDRRYARR